MADEQYEVVLTVRGNNQATQLFAQLEGRIQNIERRNQSLSRTNEGLLNSFNRLERATFGFIGAIAGNQVLQFVGDLNMAGDEANRLERSFEALSEELGDGEDILQRLRAGTQGVATDMELMAGANQLMRLQIARTDDELVELLTLITRLKDPTVETGEAIQNFALMLSNQSVQRLDSFGLSAARVQERIEQLKAAGMDATSAFNTAVIEEMRIQNERLTPAIEANITAADRLSTVWQNAMTDVGQAVNDTLNRAAFTILQTVEFLQQLAVIAQTRTSEAERARQLLEQMGIGTQPAQVGPFTFSTLTQGATEEQIQAALMAVRMQDRINDAIRQGIGFVREQIEAYREMREEAARAAAQQAADNELLQMRETLTPFFDMFFTGRRGVIGGELLFSAEETANVQMMAGEVERMLTRIEELHEQGLINDEQLEQAKELADTARTMADEAERGRDALANMTLPEALLGNRDPNELFGGIADQLMEALRDNGNITDETAQRIQDALDLASGRASEITFALRDRVIPELEEIAATGDTERLIEAITNVETFLREQRLAGTPEELIAAGLPFAITETGQGLFNFSLGMAEAAESAANWLADQLGIQQAIEQTDFVSRLSGPISQANKEADELAQTLSDLERLEHKVNIRLNVDAPTWLVPLLEGTSFARVVRDNGGSVPGADKRTQIVGGSNPR